MNLGEIMRDELGSQISNVMRFPMIQDGRKTFDYELWSEIKKDLGIKVTTSTPKVTKIF